MNANRRFTKAVILSIVGTSGSSGIEAKQDASFVPMRSETVPRNPESQSSMIRPIWLDPEFDRAGGDRVRFQGNIEEVFEDPNRILSLEIPSLKCLDIDIYLDRKILSWEEEKEASLKVIHFVQRFHLAKKALTMVPGLLEREDSPFKIVQSLEFHNIDDLISSHRVFNALVSYFFDDCIRGTALFERVITRLGREYATDLENLSVSIDGNLLPKMFDHLGQIFAHGLTNRVRTIRIAVGLDCMVNTAPPSLTELCDSIENLELSFRGDIYKPWGANFSALKTLRLYQCVLIPAPRALNDTRRYDPFWWIPNLSSLEVIECNFRSIYPVKVSGNKLVHLALVMVQKLEIVAAQLESFTSKEEK
ncbi:hypothetical protein LINPERHAP2_LOCUS35782 [Linum perenne]